MDDERASAEEMGERSIDRIRQIYDKALAKAHDVESFNEAIKDPRRKRRGISEESQLAVFV